MSSSRNKFTILQQNSVTDVPVGFHPSCWCSSRWTPAWHLHTNLYKINLGNKYISLDISYMCTKCSSDLILGEGLCKFTSFYFLDSGLHLLAIICYDFLQQSAHTFNRYVCTLIFRLQLLINAVSLLFLYEHYQIEY